MPTALCLACESQHMKRTGIPSRTLDWRRASAWCATAPTTHAGPRLDEQNGSDRPWPASWQLQLAERLHPSDRNVDWNDHLGREAAGDRPGDLRPLTTHCGRSPRTVEGSATSDAQMELNADHHHHGSTDILYGSRGIERSAEHDIVFRLIALQQGQAPLWAKIPLPPKCEVVLQKGHQ
jgi:hypothetical protein